MYIINSQNNETFVQHQTRSHQNIYKVLIREEVLCSKTLIALVFKKYA